MRDLNVGIEGVSLKADDQTFWVASEVSLHVVSSSVVGGDLEETLYALMDEHFPHELQGRGHHLVWDLMGNCFGQSFLELAQLYRALIALMPENVSQIKAAYQATVFEHDRNDEEDWRKFERE